MNDSIDINRNINRLERVTRLLDSEFSFLGKKFGLDALVGLIPWAGDVLTGLVSLYMVWRAYVMGVPKKILYRMVFNIVVDVGIGGIPVAGDLFDFWFKANTKNLRIIKKHFGVE